jgi:DNA repair exonuclease SbcCD ATPase subunit
MSHLSVETLVALRDPGTEPGEAAAREHLEACPLCRAEFERLHQRVARLKALPALRPSRERWPSVLNQLRAERQRRRFRTGGLAGLAAAASVALALGVSSLRPKDTGLDLAEIQQAMARSQVLESALDRIDPESRVMDGQTAGIAQELEDRIARVDRELEMTELMEQQARDAELLRLWRERVGLLDALVDVHVTRASNVGL